MATLALTSNTAQFIGKMKRNQTHTRAKVHFDGGRRENQASYGWVAYVAFDTSTTENLWQEIASKSYPLGDVTTAAAELAGACDAISWILHWLHDI